MDQCMALGEKALRKQQLCLWMMSRASANTAICELILLSRMKKAPPGYYFAGFVTAVFCSCCVVSLESFSKLPHA